MELHEKVEWFLVWLGLSMVITVIYLRVLGQAGDLVFVMAISIGALVSGAGGILLDKAFQFRRLWSITLAIVGMVLLFESTRVAWLGAQTSISEDILMLDLVFGHIFLMAAKEILGHKKDDAVWAALVIAAGWGLISAAWNPSAESLWKTENLVHWLVFSILALWLPFRKRAT